MSLERHDTSGNVFVKHGRETRRGMNDPTRSLTDPRSLFLVCMIFNLQDGFNEQFKRLIEFYYEYEPAPQQE